MMLPVEKSGTFDGDVKALRILFHPSVGCKDWISLAAGLRIAPGFIKLLAHPFRMYALTLHVCTKHLVSYIFTEKCTNLPGNQFGFSPFGRCSPALQPALEL